MRSVPASAMIVVDQPTALVDAPITIALRGFPPRQPVTVTAIQTFPSAVPVASARDVHQRRRASGPDVEFLGEGARGHAHEGAGAME